MGLNEQLNQVFQTVFDDPKISVSTATTAADVADWDSVSHITLICAIEEAFEVNFSAREVASLNNVGDLMTMLKTKTGRT